MFAQESLGYAPYRGLEVKAITVYVKRTFPHLGQLSGSCVIKPDCFPKGKFSHFYNYSLSLVPSSPMAGSFSSFTSQPKCGFLRDPVWPCH